MSLTRKERLGQAFIAAGSRGLTRQELEREAGRCWRLRLEELRVDGWTFAEQKSRFGQGRTFRWILLVEPSAAGDVCPVPATGVLFEPPPAKPVSALEAA